MNIYNLIQSYKNSQGCNICGRTSCKLEFHHMKNSRKLFGICSGVGFEKYPDLVIAEMTKCMVLCVECHDRVDNQTPKDKKRSIFKNHIMACCK